jgi:hypothetical protein
MRSFEAMNQPSDPVDAAQQAQPREIRNAPDRPPLDNKALRLLPYALAGGITVILLVAAFVSLGA